MKHFKVLAFFLLAIFMVAGSSAFASGPARVIWWELESDNWDYDATLSKTDKVAYRERPKTLILRQGKFTLSRQDQSAPGQSLRVNNARVWIRNPEGVVSEVNPSGDNKLTLELPSDLNPGGSSGSYLVGTHLDAGVMDFDSDGTDERVHLYSNCLVRYYKQGGIKYKNADMFFNDEDKIALEIGPFIPKSISKKAGCPGSGAIKSSKGYARGGYQTMLREYKMKVFYKGQPLADAEVVILSKSGWKKVVMTDFEGIISITPPRTLSCVVDTSGTSHHHGKIPGDHPEIREGAEKYQHAGEGKVGHAGRISHGSRHTAGDKLLYVVVYKDPSTGEYHCATLPMTLGLGMWPYHKWESKSRGFAFWGIIGAGLGVVGVGGGIYHRKRRNRETIFKSKKS
jgi:hypothetical protein